MDLPGQAERARELFKVKSSHFYLRHKPLSSTSLSSRSETHKRVLQISSKSPRRVFKLSHPKECDEDSDLQKVESIKSNSRIYSYESTIYSYGSTIYTSRSTTWQTSCSGPIKREFNTFFQQCSKLVKNCGNFADFFLQFSKQNVVNYQKKGCASL